MSREISIWTFACFIFAMAVVTPKSVEASENVEGEEAQKAAAITSAEEWLNLVDLEDYSKSWEEAASYFKGVVTKNQWQQAIAGARKPLGKVLERKLKTTNYMTSLPGAPDGEYVVIQFDTSFENKKSSVETITPMLDKDGKWRVSGYYIK